MSRQLLAASFALSLLGACSLTSHETKTVQQGKPARSRDLLAVIDQPGPLTVESVASADWSIDRSGLINLEHPRAKAAGLKDGNEPIQLFFHVIKHPTRGLFVVDTGVESALRDAPEQARVSGMAASAMHFERMHAKVPLGAFIKAAPEQLSGVLLTHMHLDHILGIPDVPASTPIYIGPGETSARAFLNLIVQPVTNRVFADKPPLSELAFQKDADGRFAGVLDFFGDGSLFVLHVPGHTPGSLAYLARTSDGPVLMTGDTCHTAWGWQHDVEPGSFTADHAQNQHALSALRKLAAEHPSMKVLLGHQSLAAR